MNLMPELYKLLDSKLIFFNRKLNSIQSMISSIGRSYHNAVIFAVDSESFDNFEDVRVRVVFSHPTETGKKSFLIFKCC